MNLQLGMVVLDVADLDRSIAFYRLLGLDVPDPFPDRPVALHRMESGVSIVLAEGFGDAVEPGWVRPAGFQQALEFYVGDDAAVDEMWERLTGAGHHGRMAPSSPTGIHSALVDDPDGNVVMISSDPEASPGSRA
jgi:catechol 2,3-dioxygenase-like lactoylglutathione lyase family enzyme